MGPVGPYGGLRFLGAWGFYTKHSLFGSISAHRASNMAMAKRCQVLVYNSRPRVDQVWRPLIHMDIVFVKRLSDIYIERERERERERDRERYMFANINIYLGVEAFLTIKNRFSPMCL